MTNKLNQLQYLDVLELFHLPNYQLNFNPFNTEWTIPSIVSGQLKLSVGVEGLRTSTISIKLSSYQRSTIVSLIFLVTF